MTKKKTITLNNIYDLQEKCLREYNLPIGLNDAKHALESYDTIDEQIKYLRKLGQPAIGFGDGRSWSEHAKEKLEKVIEERKKKINGSKKD